MASYEMMFMIAIKSVKERVYIVFYAVDEFECVNKSDRVNIYTKSYLTWGLNGKLLIISLIFLRKLS